MAKDHKTKGNQDEFRSIDEKASDGDGDVQNATPHSIGGSDMVTEIMRDPLRMSLYFPGGRPPKESAFYNPNKVWDSLRLGEVRWWDDPKRAAGVPITYDNIVYDIIPGWKYHPEIDDTTNKRRVFRLKDQGIAIDVEETISATSSAGRKEKVEACLKEENEFFENQILLQKMYKNVNESRPMFEGFERMSYKIAPLPEKAED